MDPAVLVISNSYVLPCRYTQSRQSADEGRTIFVVRDLARPSRKRPVRTENASCQSLASVQMDEVGIRTAPLR